MADSWRAGCAWIVVLAAILLPMTLAQDSTIKVAVCVPGYTPFVVKQEDGTLVGHDIDLFQAVWQELHDQVRSLSLFNDNGTHDENVARLRAAVGTSPPAFIELPLNGILTALDNATIDMAMCGLYQTPHREAKWDFLPPYLNGGLRAIVRRVLPILTILDLMRLVLGTPDAYALFALEVLVFCAVIYAHLLWLLEKDSNNNISQRYAEGVWDAFWLSIITAATVGYGDKTPVTYMGKFLTLVWMFLGIFLVALFSAAITTGLLNTQLGVTHTGVQVTTLDDLVTLRIGTPFPLASQGIKASLPYPTLNVTEYSSDQEVYKALEADKVDVVIQDYWQAQYMYNKVPKRTIMPTGPIFFNVDNAIALSRPGGEEHFLLQPLTQAMVEHMRGTGRDAFEKSKLVWFGDSDLSQAADDREEAQAIQNGLRAFNAPMLLLLLGMFSVWGLLVCVSNWRRLHSAHRRFKMRVALGLKTTYSSIELKQAAGEMYRRISKELLDEEEQTACKPMVTDEMVVKYLTGLGQRICVKDVHKLQEQLRAETAESFAKTRPELLPSSAIKSMGKKVGNTVRSSLKKADSMSNFSRRHKNDDSMRDRSPPDSPRGKWSSQNPFPNSVNAGDTSPVNTSRVNSTDRRAGDTPFSALGTPKPPDQKRGGLLSGARGRNIRRGSTDKRREPALVTEGQFAYICTFLILPKKMDMHNLNSHTPVLQHHIVDLRHDLERQLELLQRRIVAEVRSIPATIAEPATIMAEFFREWHMVVLKHRDPSRQGEHTCLDQLSSRVREIGSMFPPSVKSDSFDRDSFLEAWGKLRRQSAQDGNTQAWHAREALGPVMGRVSNPQSANGSSDAGGAHGPKQGVELAGLQVSVTPEVGGPLRRRRSSASLGMESPHKDGDVIPGPRIAVAWATVGAGKEPPIQPYGVYADKPPIDRSPTQDRMGSLRAAGIGGRKSSFGGGGSRRGSRGSGDEVWDHIFVSSAAT